MTDIPKSARGRVDFDAEPDHSAERVVMRCVAEPSESTAMERLLDTLSRQNAKLLRQYEDLAEALLVIRGCQDDGRPLTSIPFFASGGKAGSHCYQVADAALKKAGL